ncbi:MAG TPA: histidinol dehydrogenase [Fimbriimonas sp.]|nr:histidinol dehydrogenase [Fimbriimonas sp.]
MIRIVDSNSEDVFALLRERSIRMESGTQALVAEIIEDVRVRGDAALLESARRFDAPGLESIVVDSEEIAGAELPGPHVEAIREALKRITAFHEKQADALFRGWTGVLGEAEHRGAEGRLADDGGAGIYMWGSGYPGTPKLHSPQKVREGACGQRIMPVARAGVYVPGGKASYPSSVLMNVGPANVARVPEVVVTTPALSDGTLPPAVLFALREAGVSKAFKIGGAAAIAALALGTESVPRVDKIVGPGNRYVNEAKRQLWGTVGLDGYAGPSEVCVIADSEANPAWAAADLITQIEHSDDNQGFLICFSEVDMNRILAEVWEQVKVAPRQNIIRKALGESLAIIAKDPQHACEIVDAIAPEHLTIMTRNPDRLMARIRNAGCFLLGPHTPESAADWAVGPSHTLPTAGGARFGSPVNVMDFLKFQSVTRMTEEQLRELAPVIEAFGEMEGFPAHARGTAIRFE